MATQGWYNHYDDPDEFWDEAPLKPAETVIRAAATAPTANPGGSTGHRGSSRTVSGVAIQGTSATETSFVSSTVLDGVGYSATSGDGLASVTVTSGGEVRAISLAKGFGDRGLPAWKLADEVLFASQAIVDAVNSARSLAAAGEG